jgi:predicted metal-binding membrane protein
MAMKALPVTSPDMGMALPSWSFAGALAFVVAWGVMMTAMMLPSATPMIAFYGTVLRSLSRTGQKGIPTSVFALVYLVLWLATGIPVYAISTAITAAVQAQPKLAQLLPYVLAAAVGLAGVYQFSPLKRACLRVCSSPLGFLLGRWRGGYRGTFSMALEHAVSCIGCCWGLMLVLVAVGAMSLPWVLAVAAAVFIEKILPSAERTARILGGLLIVLGLLIALQPGLAAAMRGPGM